MRVKLKVVSSILSFLLMGINLVAAAPRCYDTDNFTTNGTYGKNRGLILASLQPNVSANGGFFNATIGQNTDKVYALGMCIEGDTSDRCSRCLNFTIHDLIASCPNQKEALSWGGDILCLVRYANRSFFGILELDPIEAGYNTADITSNLTEFDTVWDSLMDSVVKKASNSSSSLKYATGEADVTALQRIYSLMQCTPDLSHKDCDSCLRNSASTFQNLYHGKQGGFVRRPNCYFRWDLYPFYVPNASTTASLSPPPPPATPPLDSVDPQTSKEGGGISSRTLIIIVVPSVIFMAVLVILGVVVLPKRIRKKKQNDQNNKIRVESLQTDFNAAWRNWNEGIALEFVDPILRDGSRSEIMRCIHLGLLCVQGNIVDRSTMASVIVMLSSHSKSLPVPSRPAFCMNSTMETATMSDSSSLSNPSKREAIQASINDASISKLHPR